MKVELTGVASWFSVTAAGVATVDDVWFSVRCSGVAGAGTTASMVGSHVADERLPVASD